MTSQLNVDTIVDKAGSGGTNVKMANTSTYVSDGGAVTQNTVQGLAKAWTIYTTVTSTSITDSFNVSSLNDTATGRTDIVFSNNMASTGATGSGNVGDRKANNSVYVEATNKAANITFHTINDADLDKPNVSAIVHGDLA